MPRSFQKRRGKPRLELQQENAQLPQKSQQPTKSRLSKISINEKKENEEEKQLENEKELQEKMWKHVAVSKENPIEAPLHRSQFAVRFPQSRQTYIRTISSKMRRELKQYGIHVEPNYSEGVLTVLTTESTWDPYAVIKARDMMRLIARYVPFEEARKVMNDNVFSDIIEIGKTQVSRNQVRFIKRRARLIGPNGVTLRAIELLTKCYVLVYGRTVCVIGPMNGIQTVRQIVLDCMKNIHPIYALKRLMVVKELKQNENLKNQSWNRFLPTFKKIRRTPMSATSNFGNTSNLKRGSAKTLYEIKKNMQKKRNKRYTPFPPAPVPSKVDIAMESGEFWNNQWRKDNLKRVNKENKLKQLLKEKDIKDRQNQIRKKKQEKIAKKMKKFEAREAPKEIDSNLINKRLNLQNKIGTMGINFDYKNKKEKSKRQSLLKQNIESIQSKANPNSNNSSQIQNFLLQ